MSSQIKTTEHLFAFLALYAEDEQVTVKPGEMAVTVSLCYDDSDMQSDYHNSHASLSPELVLAVLPKGPETEKKARAALAKFAELSSVEFKWHTEKYSMGHGNYLESVSFELPAELMGWRNAYRGGPVTHGHWEVEFRACYNDSSGFTLHWAKGCAPVTDKTTGSSFNDGKTLVSIRTNEEKGGVELFFAQKPSEAVLQRLKDNGWRWSRFSSCWYARKSDAALKFAGELVDLAVKGDAPKAITVAGLKLQFDDDGSEAFPVDVVIEKINEVLRYQSGAVCNAQLVNSQRVLV